MKKKKQKLYKSNQSTDLEYTRIIKIMLGVAAVLLIVYLVTALATGEIKLGKKKPKTKEETQIQYQEILAGETFNRNKEEYYVIFYKASDTFASYYETRVGNFNSKSSATTMYIVDLENGLNEKYLISDEEEVNTQDINSLKVDNPTIIKINNKKSVEVINGRENVIEFFNNN